MGKDVPAAKKGAIGRAVINLEVSCHSMLIASNSLLTTSIQGRLEQETHQVDRGTSSIQTSSLVVAAPPFVGTSDALWLGNKSLGREAAGN